MIKVNNGDVRIKGNMPEIMADFSTITNAMYEMLIKEDFTEEDAKERLEEAFESGFLDAEELLKSALKELPDILEDLLELASKMKMEKEGEK